MRIDWYDVWLKNEHCITDRAYLIHRHQEHTISYLPSHTFQLDELLTSLLHRQGSPS